MLTFGYVLPLGWSQTLRLRLRHGGGPISAGCSLNGLSEELDIYILHFLRGAAVDQRWSQSVRGRQSAAALRSGLSGSEPERP